MQARTHDDRDARFQSLFRSNMNAVYGYACRLLRDTHTAEDAAQEVFLKLYRSIMDGTRLENPRGWLMVATRNHCLNRMRRDRREVPLESLGQPRGRDERGRAAAGHLLETALGRLDVRQREALMLKEFEGYTYAEIAEMTDTTIAGVRSQLYRARVELRRILETTPDWRRSDVL